MELIWLVVKGKIMERKNDYIYGNAVRQAAPVQVPEVLQRPRTDKKKRQADGVRRRQALRKQDLKMSIPYVAFLGIMAIIIVMTCVNYLELNSKIRQTETKITTLNTRLDTLTTKNDALDYEINGYVDINYITTKASEMGMVPAKEEQIKYYDSTEGEYMKQINDVPAQ